MADHASPATKPPLRGEALRRETLRFEEYLRSLRTTGAEAGDTADRDDEQGIYSGRSGPDALGRVQQSKRAGAAFEWPALRRVVRQQSESQQARTLAEWEQRRHGYWLGWREALGELERYGTAADPILGERWAQAVWCCGVEGLDLEGAATRCGVSQPATVSRRLRSGYEWIVGYLHERREQG